MTTQQMARRAPGTLTIKLGLFIAAIGAVFITMTMTQGTFGAPTTWGMVIIGLVIAAVGFARRVLAALEKR
ncbi:hypothetical protein [Arthrobacter roseus]|uniref:hypothetical protein n=1 Tax=Arthrobacter roseus TaxID=136274 RepID=UPI00196442AE|nr:hypothetical protein [Arthrobacter roseus]MBM7847457.1 hypothetical protein [Arthrobacter roseus]